MRLNVALRTNRALRMNVALKIKVAHMYDERSSEDEH